VGIIDERSDATKGDATDLMVGGRCVVGLLLDSVVPQNLLSLQKHTLEMVALKAIEHFPGYFDQLTTNLAASRYKMSGGSAASAPAESGKVIPPDRNAIGAALLAGNAALAAELSVTRYAPTNSNGSPSAKVGTNSPYYAGVGDERFIKQRAKLGTTWYALLNDMAKQIGAHIFNSADGNLNIARPCYTTDPSAYGQGIVLNWDAANRRAAGGNVLGVDCTRSIVGRCSQYIISGVGKVDKNNTYTDNGDPVGIISGYSLNGVLTAAVTAVAPLAAPGLTDTIAALDKAQGLHQFIANPVGQKPVSGASKGFGSLMDPGPTFWAWNSTYTSATPRLQKLGYIETKTNNPQRLTRIVRRRMIENALAAYQLNYQVKGHHAPTGILYVPDTCINVLDQRNKIQGVYYIHSVKRSCNIKSGRTTTLKLWPINLWLTDNDESSVSWPDYYQAIAPLVTW
jgi:hypothetical protein